MKRFSTSGLTAAGVLVLALGAGAVGGVVFTGGSDAPQSAPISSLGVSGGEPLPDLEADPAVLVSPTPVPTSTADPVEGSDAAMPVSSPPPPAPVPTGSTETARQAADRADKAAKRAEDAADRAESGPTPAPTPKPQPTPVPTPTPTVSAPQPCTEGDVISIGRWDEQVCRNGRYVSAAPNRHCKFGGSTPSYVESGTVTKRKVGGEEYTYRCDDGQLTLVDDDE